MSLKFLCPSCGEINYSNNENTDCNFICLACKKENKIPAESIVVSGLPENENQINNKAIENNKLIGVLSEIEKKQISETNIQCQKCNAVLSPEAKFCNKCGEKIERIYYCSKCGKKIINTNSRYCPNCGESLLCVENKNIQTDIKTNSINYDDYSLRYQKIFQRFDNDIKNSHVNIKINGWNWAGAFLGFFWLIYKKQWIWAFGLLIIDIIIGFLLEVFLVSFSHYFIIGANIIIPCMYGDFLIYYTFKTGKICPINFATAINDLKKLK